MALKDVLEHLQKATAEVEILAKREEEQARTGKAPMWVFVYEQKYTDVDEWGWNDQLIEAWDVEAAFRTFGFVLRELKLTVRNINYGLWDDMQDELERIRAWRDKEFGKGKR